MATLPLNGDGNITQNSVTPADGVYKLKDAAAGAGHKLAIRGSDAGSGSNGNGGDINLLPGKQDGTGKSGEVLVGGESIGNRKGVLFQKFFNVKAYGAVGGHNIVSIIGGSMSNGSNTLFAPSGTFFSTDIGKIVMVPGTGPGGSTLVSIIDSYGDSDRVNLKAVSFSAFSGMFKMAVDDAISLQAALDSAALNIGGNAFLPEGVYYSTRSLIIPRKNPTGIPGVGDVNVIGANIHNTSVILCPCQFTDYVSKTADESILSRTGGLNKFSQIRAGDRIKVGNEATIKTVKSVETDDSLTIHGTWENTQTDVNMEIFRSVFRVQELEMYKGTADFVTNTNVDAVSIIPPSWVKFPNYQGDASPVGNFVKRDGDNPSAWSEIIGYEPSTNPWPTIPTHLSLAYNYRGSPASAAPFTVKGATTGPQFRELQLTILDDLPANQYGDDLNTPNLGNIGIEMSDIVLGIIERVLIYGPAFNKRFYKGIALHGPHNSIRNCDIRNCNTGIWAFTDSDNKEVDQVRIENCIIQTCKNYGILLRGYNSIVSGCVIWGVWSGTAPINPGWNDVGIRIDAPASLTTLCRGNVIFGCYFERLSLHISMGAQGNSVINNFFSMSGYAFPQPPILENFNFFNYDNITIEPSTTKSGNTFPDNNLLDHNYGKFSKGTNDNVPGQAKFSSNASIGIGRDHVALNIETTGGAITGGSSATSQKGLVVDFLPSISAITEVLAGYFKAWGAASTSHAFTAGIAIANAGMGTGATITTLYGLYIDSQTQGSANYAICTNSGWVKFGDLVLTTASHNNGAGLRLPHGSAPTSPVDGDIWTTSAGLFVRINGATVGPLS